MLNTKLYQQDIINAMSQQPLGKYTVNQVRNILKSIGIDKPQNAVRNHLLKIEHRGFIFKRKLEGAVTFEFTESTTSSFNNTECKILSCSSIVRSKSRSIKERVMKMKKVSWGEKKNGVRMAMKPTGTVMMIGV